jgi:hypothetical protein
MKVSNEDTIKYPSSNDITGWMGNMFKKELKPKVYSEKAIDAMSKRGIKPQVQKDILTILIAGSEEHVHVGLSKPLLGGEFNSGIMGDIQDYDVTFLDDYTYIKYEHDSPLKETDNVKNRIFKELTVLGIYTDDEQDDEMVFDF